MPDNVTRIGVTTNGVNPYAGGPKGNEAKAEDKKPETATPEAPQVAVNPDDVFKHMAAAAVGVNPNISAPKTYDVSKYVTAEQAARIAGSMQVFEEAVTKGLLAIENEFGNTLSDSAKYALAAEMAG